MMADGASGSVSPLTQLRRLEDLLRAGAEGAGPPERALLHREAVYLALDLGDVDRAMRHALACLDLARLFGDGPLRVKAHVAMALVQAETYDDLGANTQFNLALSLARESQDDRGVALVAVNSAHYELERRHYGGAMQHLTALLESPHVRGLLCPDARGLLQSFHSNFVAGACEALLAAELTAGQGRAAEKQLRISAAFVRTLLAAPGDLDSSVETAGLLDAMIRYAIWQGDFGAAQHLADQQVELATQLHSPLLMGQALLGRSRVLGLRTEWNAAIADAARAVQAFRSAGAGMWDARASEALADALAHAGRLQEAYETQRAVTRGVERLYRDYHQQRALVSQIEQQARVAEVRASALAEAALRDPLTGIPNRTWAMQRLAELHQQAQRGRPSVLALMDLDHFKRVNDTYGHIVGDAVLVRVTRLLSEQLSAEGQLARLGGEEFVLILPELPLGEALKVCERLCRSLSQASWAQIAPGLRSSASFGLAALDGQREVTAALQAADTALYVAKAEGRNTVRVNGVFLERPDERLLPAQRTSS